MIQRRAEGEERDHARRKAFSQLLDIDGLRDCEMVARHAPEIFEMGATTEFFSHVSRQRPDVSSARAGNFDFDLAIAQWLQAERVDPDRTRLTWNFFSLARQAVQPHPVFLESREHRRHLLERASEFFLQVTQLGSTDT